MSTFNLRKVLIVIVFSTEIQNKVPASYDETSWVLAL
jgi:hypothetical protein